MNWMAAALAAASLAFVSQASAESAFGLAFRGGTLDSFQAGDRLDYRSAVSVPDNGTDDSTVSVELEDGGKAAIEVREEDAEEARRLAEFDAGVGNPLAMYFLERTVRSVAEQTGGSSFYLRNRIKDALRMPEDMREIAVDWHGQLIPATEIVLAPFDGDPNLARLGKFGDLRIRFVVGERVPGWYHTLEAESGDGAFTSMVSLTEVVK